MTERFRPNDATEGYAADWTLGQRRESAQKIADRIEALMTPAASPADASRIPPPSGESPESFDLRKPVDPLSG